METVYGAMFFVGVVVVVFSLFVGDFDADHDGGYLLSPLAIAAGLVAGSATGLALQQWIDVVSAPFAVGAFVVAYAATRALSGYLKRQGSNSHVGLQSYVGQEARVTGVYADRCTIAFSDRDGARVERTALNSHDVRLQKDDRVVIHSVENGELIVAPYDA